LNEWCEVLNEWCEALNEWRKALNEWCEALNKWCEALNEWYEVLDGCVPGKEAGADGQPVQQVVCAVGQQVQVTKDSSAKKVKINIRICRYEHYYTDPQYFYMHISL
jgi:hypothetical protein